MREHVKLLAILNLAYGGLVALCGVMALLFLGGMSAFLRTADKSANAAPAASVLAAIGTFVFFLMLALSLPSLFAGWGLLNYREWARILTLVLSALHLVSFPIGTLLGIYGFYVLLNDQTRPLFHEAAAAGTPVP